MTFRPTQATLFFRKTAAPTVNDDQNNGYLVGDIWLDETNDKAYVNLDVTAGAAVWTEITQGGGAVDHGALTGLADDDHPQYVKDSEFTTKGDLLTATGAAAIARLGVGSNSQVLTADSVQASGLKWATPSASAGFSSKISATRLGAAQSIPASTWTKAQLDSEDFDILGEFDNTVNYRFTPQVTGYYLACGGVAINSLAANKRIALDIYRTGVSAAFSTQYQPVSNNPRINVSKLFYLTTSDYLELFIHQNDTVARNMTGGLPNTFLTVHRIS